MGKLFTKWWDDCSPQYGH